MCRWTSELQARLTVSRSGIVTRLSIMCLMEHVMGCSAMTSQVQDVLRADEPGTSEMAQSWVGVAT